MKLHLLAVPILVASLVAACGGASDAANPRRGDATPPLRRDTTTLNSGKDMNLPPSPQDMPGKGRGSEPLKGKP